MLIKVLKEAGYEEAMLGLSLNKNQPVEQMPEVAKKLAPLDKGHNKFLEFMEVWLDITAPRYWWSQFDTYRIGVSKQSQSTMHTIMKQPLSQDDFSGNIPPDVIEHLNNLIEAGCFVKVKGQLPEAFLQRRIVKTNYKALRNIVAQRENHRLVQWKRFVIKLKERLMFPEWVEGENERTD